MKQLNPSTIPPSQTHARLVSVLVCSDVAVEVKQVQRREKRVVRATAEAGCSLGSVLWREGDSAGEGPDGPSACDQVKQGL